MSTLQALEPALQTIEKHAPGFKPKVGIILGSGLAPLANEIENAVTLSYEDIPGLPVSSVAGHAGTLVLGYIKGVPVVCLKGRVHYYEGADANDFKMLVRLIKALGCNTVLITNASGSLRKEIGPGEIVLINDHLNFQFRNPLVGANEDEFGSRFFPVDDTYDKDLREKLHASAKDLGIKTHEGVYVSVLGPCFDTPAEIKAFRMLGADVVGMSTIPEVLVAKHCGLRIAVLAAITNLSADISDIQLTHDVTLKYGEMSSANLCAITKRFFERFGDEL